MYVYEFSRIIDTVEGSERLFENCVEVVVQSYTIFLFSLQCIFANRIHKTLFIQFTSLYGKSMTLEFSTHLEKFELPK